MTNAEIVFKLSMGFTAKEIADEFETTQDTVEGRIRTMKERFRCYTVCHLVAIYLRKRLIE